jgi:hypothetical protein
MRIVCRSVLSLSLACAVLTCIGCNKVEIRMNGKFTGHKLIVLHNRVRVKVEAEGEASFAYEGVNIRTHGGSHPPYYDWRVTTSAGKFHITDCDAGDGAVLVNGQSHWVGLEQHLVIDSKGQISTAPGKCLWNDPPAALRDK